MNKHSTLLLMAVLLGSLLFQKSAGAVLDSTYNYTWSNCWSLTSKTYYTYQNNLLTQFTTKTWNSTSSNFIVSKDESNYYDAQNRLQKKIQYDNSYGDVRDTVYYYYDSQNRLSTSRMFYNYGANPPRIYVDSIVYDNNLKKRREVKTYISGILDPQKEFSTWLYDANNNPSSMITGYITGSDTSKSKMEMYTYQSNKLKTKILLTWNKDSVKWLNSTKMERLLDGSSNIITETNYTWTNYQWKQANLYTNSFNASNYLVNSKYMYNIASVAENIPYKNYIVSRDENGLALDSVTYTWNYYAWLPVAKTTSFYSTTKLTTNYSNTCQGVNSLQLYYVKDCPSEVKKLDYDNNITVWPNPSNGSISVLFKDKQAGIYQLYLLSSDGRTAFSTKINVSSPDLPSNIQLDGVADGMYVIKITSGNGSYQGKLMITRK